MDLHAQIIKENGKPKFAVLLIEEYDDLMELLSGFDTLEGLSDYFMALKTKTWHSLEDVKAQLGIE